MTDTTLDTIKASTLRIDQMLDLIVDSACTPDCDSDHDELFELIDATRRMIWLAAAEHVPGISWAGDGPEYEGDAYQRMRTYDDGSPVYQHVQVGPDLSESHYYPRHDGPLEAYVALFAQPVRHLRAVEEAIPE